MGRIPDSEFGGFHILGTGSYYAKTPEQADQLYEDLKAEGVVTDPSQLPPKAEDPYEAGGEFDDPGGEGHPGYDPETNTCDVHPEGCDVDGGEDARGPFGPKMPKLRDLPSYTLIGQILKRFGK
jgi:hypothetical protein